MKKVGVIFGGMSTENEVSKMSAKSIMENVDKKIYDVSPIYISLDGKWYDGDSKQEIQNVFSYLSSFDIIFPVLHGLYGEDGTIQGMLELLKIPYVGCKVLSSSVGMDKVYTKALFERAGFNQAKYIVLKKVGTEFKEIDKEFTETSVSFAEVEKRVSLELKYPVYVKPSNSGSSVGVKKVDSSEGLISAIEEASGYDDKVLIEEGIDGREIECAVMGNDEVITSGVGEVKPAEEFYSFSAKYEKEESKVIIPASLEFEVVEQIKELSEKAFRVIGGSGLSRVDFFIENVTGKIYINEINTMPGFTKISMFPKLFEESGIGYTELITRLIELT